MSVRERAVELVLKARNLLSRNTDEAANSVRALQEQIRGLEDQKTLVQQFQRSATATERARQQWERAEQQVARLSEEIEASGEASDYQRQRLAQAQRVAGQAESGYREQSDTMARLSEELRDAGINTENLSEEQIRIARETAEARRALSDYNDEVQEGGNRLQRMGKTLAAGAVGFAKWAAAGAAAGAALSVGLLTRYTAAQAEMAQQIDNTSSAIGVSAQRLQELQYAFSRVGIDADATGDLLKDVADKIGDAYQNGGGEAKDAIDALGLSLDRLIGMSPDEQLLAIAEALRDLPQASQVNIMESLASDASLLLPLLRDNAAGLRELTAEAEEFGAIISQDEIDNLLATNRALDRIQGRLQGLRNRLVSDVSPAVNGLADSFDDLLADNPRLIDDLSQVFQGLIQQTQRWIEYVVTNRERVGAALQSLIDTAQFLGNAFVSAFRGIQTAATGVLTVVASVVSGVMTQIDVVAQGLNRLGLVSDETMARLSARAESARLAVAELGRQTLTYGEQTLKAGRAAVSAYDNSGAAATRAGQAAAQAAQQHANVSQVAINSALLIAQAARTQAQEQQRVNQALVAARQRHAELAEQLAENPTAEASLEYERLGNRIRYLEGQLRQASIAASDNAKALEAAASAIGLTVSEIESGVSDMAAAAIKGFDTLVSSGEYSAAQLQEAFDNVLGRLESPEEFQRFGESLQRMVDAGIDGAGAWLKAWQAAFDGVGKGSEEAADTAVSAMDRIRRAAEKAAAAREKASSGSSSTSSSRSENPLDESNEDRKARIRQEHDERIAAVRQRNRETRARVAANLRAAAERKAAKAAQKKAEAQREEAASAQQAARATDSLNQTLDSNIARQKEQLAQLEGDNTRVQQLRYERERLALEEQLQKARASGDAEAQRRARESLELAEQIHRRKLQQAREQQKAAQGGRLTQPTVAHPTQATQAAQAAQATRAVRITLETPNGTADITANDDRSEQLLIDALGRDARRTV